MVEYGSEAEAQQESPEMEQGEVAGEQQEAQILNEILTMVQSGDASVLPKIGELVQQLLQHNQEEESQMGGEQDVPNTKNASREAMLAAVKKQMGE